MMIFPTRDATLAMAGVMQALYWVHRIAAQGENPPERLQHSLNSILCTNPPEVMSVYGSLEQLRDGLSCLEQVLFGRGQLQAMEQALLTRYAGQILRLGVQIRRSPSLTGHLAEGLARLPQEADNTEELQRLQVEKLAELYVARISPLRPRVMVSGQPHTLKNHEFVTAIRCHLLAAVRSAVLWHQCGGRFWQLILLRGFWLKQTRLLIADLA